MRNAGVELVEINYAKTALTEALVLDVVAKAGSVLTVLNTRHATAKANGWAEAPPTAAVFAASVVAEPNLLKRPIVIAGDQVIVGFNRTAYAKLR